MKWARLGSLGSILIFSCIANGQTLEQAIAHTIVSNPEIKSSYHDFKSYIETNNSTKGNYLPSVNLDTGIGFERINPASNRETSLTRKDATLSLSQLLWDGNNTLHNIDRTQAEAESVRYQLLADAENKALEVSNVYLNAVKDLEILKLSERNLAIHTLTYSGLQLLYPKNKGLE